MKEAEQLMEKYTALESEMQRFCTLAKQVMECIGRQEFVPEKVNTDMMQCIIELNKKEKDCFSLYSKMRKGERPPVQLEEMKSQIQRQIDIEVQNGKKEKYLAAVKASFHSLYTEDAEVAGILDSFKKKMDVIRTDKYTLEQCMVYIRPFAVFLDMLREDNPVRSFEQVPVLVDYFGSELVAHITVVKDIHIGEGAVWFNLDDVNGNNAGGNAGMANTPSGETAAVTDNVAVVSGHGKTADDVSDGGTTDLAGQADGGQGGFATDMQGNATGGRFDASGDGLAADSGSQGAVSGDGFIPATGSQAEASGDGFVPATGSQAEASGDGFVPAAGSQADTAEDDFVTDETEGVLENAPVMAASFPVDEEEGMIVAETIDASDALTKMEASQFKDMPVMEEEIPIDLDDMPVRRPKRDSEKVRRAVEKTAAAAQAGNSENRIERLERLEEEKRQREEAADVSGGSSGSGSSRGSGRPGSSGNAGDSGNSDRSSILGEEEEEIIPINKWDKNEKKEVSEEDKKKDHLKVLLSDESDLEAKLFDEELEQMERKKNAPKTFWGKYKEE